jgi:long-chain acyl-CoA synthetase
MTTAPAQRATGNRRSVSNPAELPPGTLVDLFLAAVDRKHPGAQMHRTDDGWQKISHEAIYSIVRSIAGALHSYGFRRGDRLGLLSENRPEWAWCDYAFLCSGIQTVPVYPTLPANQIEFILRHAGCRLLFVSTQAQLDKALEAKRELPELERIVVFDDVTSTDPAVMTLSALLAHGNAHMLAEPEFRAEAKKAQPDDVATLIYTSGTTGEPKGVMLTHDNLHSNVVACVRHVLDTGGDDVALSFLPLSHVFQRMVDYLMFANATPIAYVPLIDNVASALQEVKPTIAVAVPRVYEKLYAKILDAKGAKRKLVMWARAVALEWAEITLKGATPALGLRVQHGLADRLVYTKVRARLGGRLRFFVSGGAPLAPQIAQFFFGAGVMILEGYGLTETSPVTNVNQPKALRFGTVGKVIPGTEIRLADDDEILVRGPQVMKGYYKNDEATRAAIDEQGWFHTGDIGAIDADGFLRITDRKKDLLVTAGGKNIAPQPLQNAAKLSRFVQEALLIGDRRPYPMMLVVPNFDMLEKWSQEQGINASDHAKLIADSRVRAKLEEEVNARVSSFAHYEVPKKLLLLPREFSIERGEMTPKLSIKRRVVEQNYSSEIEAAYAEPAPASH